MLLWPIHPRLFFNSPIFGSCLHAHHPYSLPPLQRSRLAAAAREIDTTREGKDGGQIIRETVSLPPSYADRLTGLGMVGGNW